MTRSLPVRPDDVATARKLLRGIVSPTPMLHSRVLSDRLRGAVYLKCENLQRTGSFKARGAYTRISRLTEEERSRGVVAASAGNHAQGVPFAAAMLGTHATVIMPEGAPLPKVEATRGYGAEVILQGDTVDEALAVALAYAEDKSAVFIHPFNHPDVVAGQGSSCRATPSTRRWPSRWPTRRTRARSSSTRSTTPMWWPGRGHPAGRHRRRGAGRRAGLRGGQERGLHPPVQPPRCGGRAGDTRPGDHGA